MPSNVLASSCLEDHQQIHLFGLAHWFDCTTKRINLKSLGLYRHIWIIAQNCNVFSLLYRWFYEAITKLLLFQRSTIIASNLKIAVQSSVKFKRYFTGYICQRNFNATFTGFIVKSPCKCCHWFSSHFTSGILQSSPNLRIGASEDILDGIPVIDYIPGVQQIHLDTTNLQGCGEACLEQILIVRLHLPRSINPIFTFQLCIFSQPTFLDESLHFGNLNQQFDCRI